MKFFTVTAKDFRTSIQWARSVANCVSQQIKSAIKASVIKDKSTPEMLEFFKTIDQKEPVMTITLKCYVEKDPETTKLRPLIIGTMPSFTHSKIHKAGGRTLEQVIDVLEEIMQREQNEEVNKSNPL